MVTFIFALLFLAVAVVAMVMLKTYYYLPTRELKRQAEHHDPLAMTLWQAAAYGAVLRLLLWLIMVIAAAIGLVLLIGIVPTPLAIVAVGFLLLFTFGWLPNTRLTSLGGRVTVWATPALVWLLAQTNPALHWLHRQAKHYAGEDHTGLFQREDLIGLLQRQKKQADNRISADELDMAEAALQFGTRYVRDIVVPRKKVHMVAAGDEAGPIMLDELHKSQHTRFPVYDGKKDTIVGLLYLYDLVDYKGKNRPVVRSVMQERVCYVHESDSLADALQTFHQTKQQFFIVVNSFEEFVGILTLEDLLGELIGHPVVRQAEAPDNRHEVAARHLKQSDVPETEAAAAPSDESSAPAEAEPSAVADVPAEVQA